MMRAHIAHTMGWDVNVATIPYYSLLPFLAVPSPGTLLLDILPTNEKVCAAFLCRRSA